ncbi:MAG: hypothetical protein M5U18_11290 [Dehalococcoidia bacterium]|nr:hypothetical protein [Dehalococcoidia bacterium]
MHRNHVIRDDKQEPVGWALIFEDDLAHEVVVDVDVPPRQEVFVVVAEGSG